MAIRGWGENPSYIQVKVQLLTLNCLETITAYDRTDWRLFRFAISSIKTIFRRKEDGKICCILISIIVVFNSIACVNKHPQIHRE